MLLPKFLGFDTRKQDFDNNMIIIARTLNVIYKPELYDNGKEADFC
jgi:hypothetical protein